jgi:two-component system cell cycle sensor histidine kinase/response regulator CckA
MKLRILIMDDDSTLCRLYALMLDRLGCECATVPFGEKVLTEYDAAKAAGAPYHAVILDLTVAEGMGGVETIRALREKAPEVYAVVASGSSRESMESLCAGHGFNASLPKPFRIQDLADCVAKIEIVMRPQTP